MIGAQSRYEVLAPLGAGGMASVFVGRVRGADGFSRLVALKRSHPNVRYDQALSRGLKHEARIASRLHHANVVAVLDVEEVDGDVVLVLEYVEGCTLRGLTSKLEELGERRPREIVRIILDAAAGLHAAHRATDEEGRPLGIVHRDVSPSNVLVGLDGVARLSDFGIAKALLASEGRTETGILKGKASYMAPEYVTSQKTSAATDLFSLAVVAWEALAGARLFKGATDVETLMRVARGATRRLSTERPELAMLDRVFDRALSLAPSDRHASVEELAFELEAVARAHDLVASHAEVSALVARVAGSEVTGRRRAMLARSGVLARPAPGRDDVGTASASPVPTGLATPVVVDVAPVMAVAGPSGVELAWIAAPPSTVEAAAVDVGDGASPSSEDPLPIRRARRGGRDRTTVALLLASVLLAGVSIAMAASMRSGGAGDVAVATLPPAPAAPAPVMEDDPSIEEAPPVAPSEAADAPPPPVVAPRPIVKASSRAARTSPARAVLPRSPSLVPRKAPPNPYEDGARGR